MDVLQTVQYFVINKAVNHALTYLLYASLLALPRPLAAIGYLGLKLVFAKQQASSYSQRHSRILV